MLEFIILLFFQFIARPALCPMDTNIKASTVQTAVYKSSTDNVQVELNIAPSPSPSPTPQVTPTPSPEITDITDNSNTPAPTPQEEEDMDYIAELTKLGYIKNEYEDKSLNIRNGILRFQSDSNLVADGIYGPVTTASLKKRVKDTAFKYTDTVTNPPSMSYWIFINKTRRILTLYNGTEVVKKYPVAVGNPPSLTPEGHFKILIKVVNPAWGGGGYAQPIAGGVPENPLGYRWMGLDFGGGGEYGVHGNSAPYSIGTYASHGCVRMINSDVESLYEIVPEETPIWIGSDDSLEKDGIIQKEY